MNNKSIQDHLGNVFKSKKELREYYHISENTLDRRLKLGWSMEKILTTPVTSANASSQPCTDHIGNNYSSIAEMCKAYNVLPQTYTKRINKGYSVEEALTRTSRRGVTKECIDHTGQKFNSMREMCEYWNIDPDLYSQRIIAQQMSVEAALTTPVGKGSGKSCVDHLGNKYKTYKDMADTYGINAATLLRRINVSGMSVKDALTMNVAQTINWTDMIGEVFYQRVGLNCTVIANEPRKKRVQVKFEDGVTVYTEPRLVKSGKTAHPGLKYGHFGSYSGFKTKVVSETETDTYYHCECSHCGLKDILTPRQMLEHAKAHKG